MTKSLSTIMRLIANKSLSSERLVSDSIISIKANNPSVNAFSSTDFEGALEAARACDQEAKKDSWRGPLHGIPVAVKDLFLTKGVTSKRGSAAFKDFVPTVDSVIVERIEKAGAIMIGKTTTTELGWSGASTSELYGDTRNPWNPRLTSGGSSSGSAAAVAAKMVPFSLGSDGGGSVRIPASFCGIFSMKGSLGRIPVYPQSATEMLSHAGPLTNTAEDSTILFNILKGPDARDPLSLPDDGMDYSIGEIDCQNIRVGYAPTLFGTEVNSEVAKAVSDGVTRIKEGLNVQIDTVDLDWQDPIRAFETLWVAGRGVSFYNQTPQLIDQLGSGFKKLVRAAGHYSLADYLTAISVRSRFSTQINQFFDKYDFLLLPTVPILPFDAELEVPGGMIGKSEILPWTAWTPFTYPFNLSGNPAASIPVGLSSERLPIGMQIVGRRHADIQVLAFCRALELQASFHVTQAESVQPDTKNEGIQYVK